MGHSITRAALAVLTMGVAFAALVLAVTGFVRLLTMHHLGQAISLGWSFAALSFLRS